MEGQEQLDLFQNQFKPEDNINYPLESVGSGFGAASAYYFQLNIELLLLIPVFIIITFFISSISKSVFSSPSS